MIISPVTSGETDLFRHMLVDYWRDLVPKAPWLQDPILAEVQFKDRYQWNGGSNNPFWVLVDGRRVGFLMYRTHEDRVSVYIHDFYVVSEARRRGYGSEMLRQLLVELREKGITQVELSVLLDNRAGLAFWRAQGFEIESYRLSRPVDAG